MGNCTCCTSVSCMGEEGQNRRTQHPRPPTFTSVWHCQTSCPSTPGLQATSMLSVWGKVDGGRVYCSSKAVCPSRSLHIQWPSCHQSLSQCTCRLSRCHSSGQMRIPWTEEDKNKLVLRQLTFSSSFEVKWKRLADYRARLDCNDIKFWPDAPQKRLLCRVNNSGSVFTDRRVLSDSGRCALPLRDNCAYFWTACRQSVLICIPGICWRHKESSKHSTDCPSQCLQTIYLQRKQWNQVTWTKKWYKNK